MSIELPGEVEWVMGMIGLSWPGVDEDQLKENADHLRTFASSLSSRRDEVHGIIAGLASEWQGVSYDALAAKWDQLATNHLDELVTALNVVADAMDVASVAVIAQKLEVIGALTLMAVEFVTEQAAAVMTLGLAEAATVATVAATRQIVKTILDQLEQALISDGLQLALGPLEDKIDAAVQGLVLRGVADLVA